MRLFVLPMVFVSVFGCSGGEDLAPVGEAVVVATEDEAPGSVNADQELDQELDQEVEQEEAHPSNIEDEPTNSVLGEGVEPVDSDLNDDQPTEARENREVVRSRLAEPPPLELAPMEETSAAAIDALRDGPSPGTVRASGIMDDMDDQLEGNNEQDELFGPELEEGDIDPLFGD